MTRRRQQQYESLFRAAPTELAEDQDPYLEALAAELEIDPGRLEAELASQPEMAGRAGLYAARLQALRDARRRDLAAARAQVEGHVRRAARERGSSMSEQEVVAQAAAAAEVQRAVKALDDAQYHLRRARAVEQAFDQRLVALGAMVQLRGKK